MVITFTNINTSKERILTPASSVIITNIKSAIRAVPRSGCFNMSSRGANTSAAGRISSFILKPPDDLLSEKYLARNIIIASFASSDGWKESGPIASQRWAPRPVRPFIRTIIRSSSVIP